MTVQAGIHGSVSREFAAVRTAFEENFSRRREIGAACCIFHDGVKVVDLWGGVRDRATGAPWEQDTMTLVYSSTKGMAALVMALAHSRGWLDFDALVCSYWPEFAQNGKQRITVRQLLAHQAGLFGFDEHVDRSVVADNARAMAHAYGVFATGGAELGLRPETLRELEAPPRPPTGGFRDACFGGADIRFSLGFMRPAPDWSFGGPRSYGAPGAGGSFAYADPDARIGYGYVCNRMGRSRDDPRDVALRHALTTSLAALD